MDAWDALDALAAFVALATLATLAAPPLPLPLPLADDVDASVGRSDPHASHVLLSSELRRVHTEQFQTPPPRDTVDLDSAATSGGTQFLAEPGDAVSANRNVEWTSSSSSEAS